MVLDKESLKSLRKEEKKQAKADKKEAKAARKKPPMTTQITVQQREQQRVYVINFKGNIAADAVVCLREEISAILSLATPDDEVLVRLKAPEEWFTLMAWLLAIGQAETCRFLTICVDKVAASGGYMMACLADKLVASVRDYRINRCACSVAELSSCAKKA